MKKKPVIVRGKSKNCGIIMNDNCLFFSPWQEKKKRDVNSLRKKVTIANVNSLL